jgi:kynurenine formamidase
VITPKIVQDWEAKHGPLKKGDIVLFHSSYSDRYYKPFPEGNRLAFEPLILQNKPGWPAPGPETMEYLHSKGVMHVGTDGPSMGFVEGGQSTHVAGLKYGMSWDELLMNLGRLPARGAFYIEVAIEMAAATSGRT